MPKTNTNQRQHSEWFVLGAGALGCLWAAMLAQCGKKVTVIVRDTARQHRRTARLRYSRPQSQPGHADSNAADPQTRSARANSSPPTTYAVDIATLSALASAGTTIDNLLVTTKSYDALAAIEAALPLLEPGAKILTLCNGYGLHQPIAQLLSSQKRDYALYAGVCSDGALLRGPLDVIHTGIGTTKIGRFGDQSATLYLPAALLPAALQLAVEYVNTVEVSILQKFFINCAINPLTALHDCTNGELLRNPDVYVLFQQLCRELENIYQAVSQYMSAKLPAMSEAGFDVLQQATLVATATADNQSSMLQDYRKRRRLELQYLNCEVIVLAKRFNIPCPINMTLVSRLQPTPG